MRWPLCYWDNPFIPALPLSESGNSKERKIREDWLDWDAGNNILGWVVMLLGLVRDPPGFPLGD